MPTPLDPPAGDPAVLARLDPELFRALADPTRLQLVSRLACSARPQTVTEVADCCGVHLSGVSRHLAVLRRAGVVRAERCGREVRYSLEATRVAAVLREAAEAIEAGGGCCGDDGGSCSDTGSGRDAGSDA